ncbi:hypothetical protein ASPZODRAFT_150578 [Penicilliopsis zonata CBS 506.65]|uniref:DNA/RNA-binding domain-containing protein n=1 Tax=Penicilliopsis zonata CBS 506.65 TaxID=1073090 RepID=A0A1L9SM72_9EURO|nr:hypothetical protein ASPZODRAFT_150578 [Penicilliopsis zonata CBS 506.65]OJJ48290.1 hypothetical protein ASPZODRAFT_150578 [Penicilliopsis zonata CBS 506.65]
MFLQPETHPITEEQLTREVRGIYAGLTMVEKKCIEIDKLQSDSKHDLSHAQWQTLIALHRTLLHEHHDFFLASQHPFASPGLQKLAEKYSMPARMWRYGIHAFLEVLRSRLPHSLEYMLTFIYLAYSMMTLLVESVPAFEGTWIECLGDLARYRMAVEEVDMRDREIWAGVARFWYNKAADKTPGVGRIQHHLAVLARPDVVQQLFYYTKSLTTVQPFPSTRESILLLFDPLLSRPQPVVRQRHYAALTAFVTAHGFLFTRDGSSSQFLSFARQFLDLLDDYIGRSGTTFRLQGAHIVSCNFAAIFEYGSIGALLPGEFNGNKNNEMEEELVPSMEEVYLSATQYWEESQASRLVSEADYPNAVHHNPSSTMLHGSYLAFHTISILLDRVGDKNVFPSVHVSLAFIWCLCLNQGSMKYIECLVPWVSIATFLNSMIRPNVDASKIERVEFPRAETGSLQQMPEDFIIRGQVWSPHYFPPGFFDNALSEDDGRLMETPSLIISRIHRCLWLGVRLSTFQCWMTYDSTQKTFSATPYACALNEMAEEHDPFPSLHSTTTCSITKF